VRGTPPDVQAICRRHRHQPSRPPPAKIRPGSPAPAIGPGTGSDAVAVTVTLEIWPSLLAVPPLNAHSPHKPHCWLTNQITHQRTAITGDSIHHLTNNIRAASSARDALDRRRMNINGAWKRNQSKMVATSLGIRPILRPTVESIQFLPPRQSADFATLKNRRDCLLDTGGTSAHRAVHATMMPSKKAWISSLTCPL
jgi:hypothetical protein